MLRKSAKILLTGLPGCGKTTAIMKIAAKLKHTKPAGFYTQEIRENNPRKGFRWVRFDGPAGVLAHVDIKGSLRVGKYSVNVAEFERLVVPILDTEKTDAELFIIDEIGRMECLSEKFVGAVRRVFAADKWVLAAVAQKGGGFISEVKNYPGIKLFGLTHRVHDETVAEILQILSLIEKT